MFSFVHSTSTYPVAPCEVRRGDLAVDEPEGRGQAQVGQGGAEIGQEGGAHEARVVLGQEGQLQRATGGVARLQGSVLLVFYIIL